MKKTEVHLLIKRISLPPRNQPTEQKMLLAVTPISDTVHGVDSLRCTTEQGVNRRNCVGRSSFHPVNILGSDLSTVVLKALCHFYQPNSLFGHQR